MASHMASSGPSNRGVPPASQVPPLSDDDLDDDEFDLDNLGEPDPLDADDFDPVTYINGHFPNESSLGGLEVFVERLRARQRGNDEDIRVAIRKQAATGRRARSDLDEAKGALHELFDRIKAIRSKAEQSEELVSDVCRDIKLLDIAKRNLTLTVTALKRLVMLVTALEQLRTLGRDKRYDEASRLIHAVEELAGHFRDLGHVSRVADLLEKKSAVVDDLKQQLLEDYRSVHSGAVHDDLADDWGSSAASCVDSLGPGMRREVVTQFCLGVLEEYKEIFQPPNKDSGLDMASRRFHWLDRKEKQYDEKYSTTFPERWRVKCSLCEHFCHVTRQHLVEMLSTSHHTVDPELMVRVLRQSIDYENKLARRYPPDEPQAALGDSRGDRAGAASLGLRYPDVLGGEGGAAAASAMAGEQDDPQFAPRFKGIISECFDAYLTTWVQHEEKQLVEVLEKVTSSNSESVTRLHGGSQQDEDEDDGGVACLFYSAQKLLPEMKVRMDNCTAFSTHNTLFDIFKVFQKVMRMYVDRLGRRLPDPEKMNSPLDIEKVEAVCCVIGTAEYCDEELCVGLSERLVQVISPDFADRVSFGGEQDLFGNLMSRAYNVLVQSVSCCLDEAFGKMSKTNWAAFSQEVGDHSEYVGDISEQLKKHFAPVAAGLSKIHYRSFCNKFVQAFVKRYIAEIYSCRKISEQGAQQLLLDTTLIKTTLLEEPVVAGNGGKMPTAYSNYVLREMGRAETMLKVLNSPGVMDPASLSAMLGDDKNNRWAQADVDRLLALRAGADTTGGDPVTGGGDDAPAGAAAAAAGVAALGNTMESTMKHMQANMDIQKNLMNLKKGVNKFGVNLPTFGARKGGTSSSGT